MSYKTWFIWYFFHTKHYHYEALLIIEINVSEQRSGLEGCIHFECCSNQFQIEHFTMYQSASKPALLCRINLLVIDSKPVPSWGVICFKTSVWLPAVWAQGQSAAWMKLHRAIRAEWCAFLETRSTPASNGAPSSAALVWAGHTRGASPCGTAAWQWAAAVLLWRMISFPLGIKT